MLVVLEGPEKVGKTTFSRKLIDWWHWNRKTDVYYVHRPRHVNNPEDVTRDLMHVRENRDKLIIFDRFYPSDLVYRTWDGGESKFPINAGYMEEVFGPQIDREGVRLLLREDPKVLKRRRRPDDIPIPPTLEMRLYEVVCSYKWQRVSPELRMGDNWVERWANMVKRFEAAQEERNRV